MSKINEERKISIYTATFLVISTMIGTGVFTTTGYMVKSLDSPSAILFSWLLGGILALCGALSYAELVTMMPKNGGEYNILSQVYNKAVGFCCAWISLIVGFAASIASSSIAFGIYLKDFLPFRPEIASISLIIILSFIQTLKIESSSKFQDLFTIGKIALILFFIFSGLFYGSYHSYNVTQNDINYVLSPVFAVGLIYVSYAYSGWEAAGYIAGEIKNPNKSLPLSLIIGTSVVTSLYVGLNFVYLYMIPYKMISGEAEVASITGKILFGDLGSSLLSIIISFGLISAIGAMIISGSRMYQAVGEDFEKLSFFSKKNKNNIPSNAIYFQMIISIILVFSSTFDTLLKYIGFTISIFAALSVLGVIVMRIKQPNLNRTYKTFGYPFTPLIFILLSLWMIIYSIIEEPKIAFTGLGTILLGFVIYKYLLINDSKNEK